MLNLNILTHFNDELTRPLEPIISFINEDKYILKQPEIIQAIVTFNIALLLLDQKPKKEELENHVLYGDLYLAEFYIALSEKQEFETLSNVLNIAKEIINLKSLCQRAKVNKLDRRYILFGPILYLKDREYITGDIDQVLDSIMLNGDFNDK